jgi:hypothetical protein
MKTEKHIIAIGETGLTLVQEVQKQYDVYSYHALVKTYTKDAPEKIKQTLVDFPIYPKDYFLRGEILKLQIPQTILKIFNKTDEFTIVVGLGGITGTSILASLLSVLHEKQCNYKIICSLPCTFFGKIRYKRAINFISTFRVKTIHCIDLDLHSREARGDVLVSELQNQLHEIFKNFVMFQIK